MFNIVIPNFNNEEFLETLFNSLKEQTCQDFKIIFVDDMSTDNSLEIAKEKREKVFGDKMLILTAPFKLYNGGIRNYAINFCKKRKFENEYTIFIDSDDTFSSSIAIESIKNTILRNGFPDLIRLSYYWCGNETRLVDLSNQQTAQAIVEDNNVACWTKCVKTRLLTQFAENTLMEDLTQHITQLDCVTSIAACKEPIINWNRKNPNSCSTNLKLQNEKWKSSYFRLYADLMDLRLNNSAAIRVRDRKLIELKSEIKERFDF